MNTDEFLMLDGLSRYQDGVSKEDCLFNRWIRCGDTVSAVKREFDETMRGLIEAGMVEKVAPPYFNHSWYSMVPIRDDNEGAYIEIVASPSFDDGTTIIKNIGRCLYRITTKGREMLLGIHLLNGGEKEWMRVLDVREHWMDFDLWDEGNKYIL